MEHPPFVDQFPLEARDFQPARCGGITGVPSLLQEKLANDAPAMRAANSMETEMKGNNAAAQTKKHQHRDLFWQQSPVFFCFGGKCQLQKKRGKKLVSWELRKLDNWFNADTVPT